MHQTIRLRALPRATLESALALAVRNFVPPKRVAATLLRAADSGHAVSDIGNVRADFAREFSLSGRWRRPDRTPPPSLHRRHTRALRLDSRCATMRPRSDRCVAARWNLANAFPESRFKTFSMSMTWFTAGSADGVVVDEFVSGGAASVRRDDDDDGPAATIAAVAAPPMTTHAAASTASGQPIGRRGGAGGHVA